MSTKFCRRHVPSLFSMCTENVVGKLSIFDSEINVISELPDHIKDKILHKFMTTSYYWRNINFKQALAALVHSRTKVIDLTLCIVDDEILNIINVCTNLRKLFITSSSKHSMSSEGLMSLFSYLPNLYLLRLSNCSAVNDDVIVALGKHCKNLSGLDIDGCIDVTSKSISVLAPLECLLWIAISKTQVCDEGLKSLVMGRSGSRLKELRIAECPNLTECVLQTIADCCKELEVLIFYDCSKVQDYTCFTFGEGTLKNLKQLNWTIQW